MNYNFTDYCTQIFSNNNGVYFRNVDMDMRFHVLMTLQNEIVNEIVYIWHYSCGKKAAYFVIITNKQNYIFDVTQTKNKNPVITPINTSSDFTTLNIKKLIRGKDDALVMISTDGKLYQYDIHTQKLIYMNNDIHIIDIIYIRYTERAYAICVDKKIYSFSWYYKINSEYRELKYDSDIIFSKFLGATNLSVVAINTTGKLYEIETSINEITVDGLNDDIENYDVKVYENAFYAIHNNNVYCMVYNNDNDHSLQVRHHFSINVDVRDVCRIESDGCSILHLIDNDYNLYDTRNN